MEVKSCGEKKPDWEGVLKEIETLTPLSFEKLEESKLMKPLFFCFTSEDERVTERAGWLLLKLSATHPEEANAIELDYLDLLECSLREWSLTGALVMEAVLSFPSKMLGIVPIDSRFSIAVTAVFLRGAKIFSVPRSQLKWCDRTIDNFYIMWNSSIFFISKYFYVHPWFDDRIADLNIVIFSVGLLILKFPGELKKNGWEDEFTLMYTLNFFVRTLDHRLYSALLSVMNGFNVLTRLLAESIPEDEDIGKLDLCSCILYTIRKAMSDGYCSQVYCSNIIPVITSFADHFHYYIFNQTFTGEPQTIFFIVGALLRMILDDVPGAMEDFISHRGDEIWETYSDCGSESHVYYSMVHSLIKGKELRKKMVERDVESLCSGMQRLTLGTNRSEEPPEKRMKTDIVETPQMPCSNSECDMRRFEASDWETFTEYAFSTGLGEGIFKFENQEEHKRQVLSFIKNNNITSEKEALEMLIQAECLDSMKESCKKLWSNAETP